MVSDAPITVLWATQSGRAKACARRTIRMLHSIGVKRIFGQCTFDCFGASNFLSLGQLSNTNISADKGIASDGNETKHLENDNDKQLLLMFVSTTGDAEQCDSIRLTWEALLQKFLPPNLFANTKFALFALGDRAYGPEAFCAAGRKLAARLVQLGASPVCPLGYGDDGSLNGGVFADLDVWLERNFFPSIRSWIGSGEYVVGNHTALAPVVNNPPYAVDVIQSPNTSFSGQSSSNFKNEFTPEWARDLFRPSYAKFFAHSCPATAYKYDESLRRSTQSSGKQEETQTATSKSILKSPLLGRVVANHRITAGGWIQNTRHLQIHVTGSMEEATSFRTPSEIDVTNLPYRAGDVATILPSNPPSLVSRFLSVLPPCIHSLADEVIRIKHENADSQTNHVWPEMCTLRGLITHCADIQSLPEREDLRALSAYCNSNHPEGIDQRDKLISLSETSGAALFGDYIIREKRNWIDVFYDFDSIRWEKEDDNMQQMGQALLTIPHLLLLLPTIMPRHFSIASAPSSSDLIHNKVVPSSKNVRGFEFELCVALVEGQTPLGRPYFGFCSNFLTSIAPSKNSISVDSRSSFVTGTDIIRLWIRPGSFSKLPLDKSTVLSSKEKSNTFFKTPVMCIGSGTGIAPLRSLIFEREAVRILDDEHRLKETKGDESVSHDKDNILVFGCRKKAMDYYYGDEWETLVKSNRLRLVPAFSRDQEHKLYVQRALREADSNKLVTHHVLERKGAVYIAGGAKMARAVKDEIVNSLAACLEGGEIDAKKLLNKMKRKGTLSIEAWS